ncbi:MAG: alpha/beta fold hydrolase [Promethearchaeota archaeon]
MEIFYYENKIKNIPLLFIHGWLGSSLEWIYQFCYFNSRQHIIILDLPGFGNSDKPKTKYSIEFFTKQVLDFLNKLGYREIILIGHSLGGLIAQNITVKNPKIVKKLILISTSTTFSQSLKQKIVLFWLNLIFKFFYRNFLRNCINQIISTKIDNREFKKLYKQVLKIPKSVVISSFKNMTLKFNINKELFKISQPTLIIYGDKDKIISKSMINKLGNLIPNSEINILKNSAHRLMVENYTVVNKIIDDFIKK